MQIPLFKIWMAHKLWNMIILNLLGFTLNSTQNRPTNIFAFQLRPTFTMAASRKTPSREHYHIEMNAAVLKNTRKCESATIISLLRGDSLSNTELDLQRLILPYTSKTKPNFWLLKKKKKKKKSEFEPAQKQIHFASISKKQKTNKQTHFA